MGLYLPPELRWLGWIAGGAWPDGDETEVWQVSDAFKEAATALHRLTPELEATKRLAVSAYPEGLGGEKIGALFDQMIAGDQSMESLAKFMEQISDATFDYGTQIEAAKLMTIVSLIALAIEIAWAWMFPPTAPAVEAAATTATQSFLRRMELQLQERVLAKVLSVFGEKFANLSKSYVLKILEAMLISGAMDASVQVGQIAAGHRKHFDGKQFGVSVFASGLGSPFGRIAADGIGRFTGRFLGEKIANPWVRTANGAFVGITSSPAGAIFGGLGAAAITGDWVGTFGNPVSWVGGAARGGLAGGAKGFVGIYGYNKGKAFEVPWGAPRDGSAYNPGRGGFGFDAGPNGFNGPRTGFGGEHATVRPEGFGSSDVRGNGRALTFDGPAVHDTSTAVVPTRSNGLGIHGDPPVHGSSRNESAVGGRSEVSPPVNSAGTGEGARGANGAPPQRTDSVTNGRSGDSGDGQRTSNSESARSEGSRSQNSSAVNSTGGTNNSSGSGAPADRAGGASGDSNRAVRPVSGTDGSTEFQRSPASHSAASGSSSPIRAAGPESNVTAGQQQSPRVGPETNTGVGSTQRPAAEVNSGTGATQRPVGAETNATGAQPQHRVPETNAGGPRSSAPNTGQGEVPSQSQRSPGSESNSNAAGRGHRSSVPEQNAPGTGQQRIAASSGGAPAPSQRTPETGQGAAPQQQRVPGPESGQGVTAPQQRISGSESGQGATSPSQRASGSESGQGVTPQQRGSGPETNQGAAPQQRLGGPETNAGGSAQVPQRPGAPETNTTGAPPNTRAGSGEHDAGGPRPGQRLLPPPDGQQPARTTGPQDHQPADANTSRGPDGAVQSGRGGWTFEGERPANPNWIRNERGEVLVTSPDGTRHMVDQHGNITVARPGDPTAVRVRPGGGVEFVPNSADHPAAQPGPRPNLPSGSGREHEFGFGRADGTRHTVLPDGSVQTRSPDGSTTTVKRDGATEFRAPSGERTQHEPGGTVIRIPPDGPTTVTTPDGTTHVVPNDRAGWERNAEGRYLITSPDGTRHVIGTDGSMVVGRAGDPQVMRIGPDHAVVFVGVDGAGAPRGEGAGRDTGVKSPTFHRPDRVSHTVQPEGAVQTKSPDGWTTTVRPDGATEFVSPTGDKTVSKSNGTVVESGPGKPIVITAPDGTKQTAERNGAVVVENPDGSTHTVFDSSDYQGGGRTRHPDGTVMHSDLKGTVEFGLRDRLGGFSQDGPRKHGVIQMDRPDGTGFESTPKGSKVFDPDGTTYESGSRGSARVTAPNGEVETLRVTEPIELSNGARLERTPEGFRVVHPDGSVSEIGSRGATVTDADGVARATRPDGVFVTDPDGTMREIRPDGAVRVTDPDGTSWGSRPDGTTWTVDGNGKVHVSDPDGTTAPPASPKHAWVEGSDETTKTRPRRVPDIGPMPEEYHAPGAPELDDWIPPGYGRSGPGSHWEPPRTDLFLDNRNDRGPDGDDRHNGPDDDGNGNRPGYYRDSRDGSGSGGGDGAGGRRGADRSDGPDGRDERGGNDSGYDNREGDRTGDREGDSAGTSEGDYRGTGGDRGDETGNDPAAQEEPQPEQPQPEQPDPAELANMLGRIHAAETMTPPPPPSGATDLPETGASPDFSRLSGPTPAPPDLAALHGVLGQPGESGAHGLGGQGTHPGSTNSVVPEARDTRGGSSVSGQHNRPQAPGSEYPVRPPTPAHLGTAAVENHSGGPGSGERSGHAGADRRSMDASDVAHERDPGAEHRSAAQGSDPRRTGTGSSGESDGTETGAHSADGAGAEQAANGAAARPGLEPAGAEHNSNATNSEHGSGSAGGDQGSPSDHSPGATKTEHGSGTEAGPNSAAAGERTGGTASHDRPGEPGTGNRHENQAGEPTHTTHSKIPEQHNNSPQPAGTGGPHPSVPGRPAMSDGQQSAGSSAPGVPPSGAPPGAAPPAAGAKQKPPRRNRTKNDKPRKTPKSMLMPSPSEAPERAGSDDSVDVPFALNVSAKDAGPDGSTRSTAKSTRSDTDG